MAADETEKKECRFCEIAEGRSEAHIVYMDERVVAILPEEGCASGHVLVFPKKHHCFLEDVPEEDIDHLFFVASTASGVLFEALGLGGTNIIVNNFDGGAHVAIDVIPRKPDDGLDFFWEPKTLNEQEMKEAQTRIKDAAFMLNYKPPKKIVINLDEKKIPVLKGDKDNYLFRQLNRAP